MKDERSNNIFLSEGINVLSLFDGMSCGQIALKELNIKVDKYYASEIDKYAIQQSTSNFPDTIQLGSVTEVDVTRLDHIDLLIGGSPCQSFSFAGKRNGMSTKDNVEIYTLEKYLSLKEQGFEFEGESYLFWEYMRILTDIRKYNPNVLFLLENVEMGTKWERVLSEAIGIYGVHINSALVSAQIRKRIYWTNIRVKKEGLFCELHSDIPQPADKGILLKDILETVVDKKYFLSKKMIDKMNCLMVKKTNFMYCEKSKDDLVMQTNPSLESGGKQPYQQNRVYDAEGVTPALCAHKADLIIKEVVGCDYRSDEGIRYRYNGKSGTLQARGRNDESCGQLASINSRIRRLTPTECARLQTVPKWYKWNVSDTQQYKLLGNGWTVEVIKHIFSFIN